MEKNRLSLLLSPNVHILCLSVCRSSTQKRRPSHKEAESADGCRSHHIEGRNRPVLLLSYLGAHYSTITVMNEGVREDPECVTEMDPWDYRNFGDETSMTEQGYSRGQSLDICKVPPKGTVVSSGGHTNSSCWFSDLKKNFLKTLTGKTE